MLSETTPDVGFHQMITEWEIWACANYLMDKHGETVALEATMRADELLAEGDVQGMRIHAETFPIR